MKKTADKISWTQAGGKISQPKVALIYDPEGTYSKLIFFDKEGNIVKANILEIRKNKRGKTFLRLRSPNGKILMSGESYDSKRNANDTAVSIQTKPIIIVDMTK